MSKRRINNLESSTVDQSNHRINYKNDPYACNDQTYEEILQQFKSQMKKMQECPERGDVIKFTNSCIVLKEEYHEVIPCEKDSQKSWVGPRDKERIMSTRVCDDGCNYIKETVIERTIHTQEGLIVKTKHILEKCKKGKNKCSPENRGKNRKKHHRSLPTSKDRSSDSSDSSEGSGRKITTERDGHITRGPKFCIEIPKNSKTNPNSPSKTRGKSLRHSQDQLYCQAVPVPQSPCCFAEVPRQSNGYCRAPQLRCSCVCQNCMKNVGTSTRAESNSGFNQKPLLSSTKYIDENADEEIDGLSIQLSNSLSPRLPNSDSIHQCEPRCSCRCEEKCDVSPSRFETCSQPPSKVPKLLAEIIIPNEYNLGMPINAMNVYNNETVLRSRERNTDSPRVALLESSNNENLAQEFYYNEAQYRITTSTKRERSARQRNYSFAENIHDISEPSAFVSSRTETLTTELILDDETPPVGMNRSPSNTSRETVLSVSGTPIHEAQYSPTAGSMRKRRSSRRRSYSFEENIQDISEPTVMVSARTVTLSREFRLDDETPPTDMDRTTNDDTKHKPSSIHGNERIETQYRSIASSTRKKKSPRQQTNSFEENIQDISEPTVMVSARTEILSKEFRLDDETPPTGIDRSTNDDTKHKPSGFHGNESAEGQYRSIATSTRKEKSLKQHKNSIEENIHDISAPSIFVSSRSETLGTDFRLDDETPLTGVYHSTNKSAERTLSNLPRSPTHKAQYSPTGGSIRNKRSPRQRNSSFEENIHDISKPSVMVSSRTETRSAEFRLDEETPPSGVYHSTSKTPGRTLPETPTHKAQYSPTAGSIRNKRWRRQRNTSFEESSQDISEPSAMLSSRTVTLSREFTLEDEAPPTGTPSSEDSPIASSRRKERLSRQRHYYDENIEDESEPSVMMSSRTETLSMEFILDDEAPPTGFNRSTNESTRRKRLKRQRFRSESALDIYGEDINDFYPPYFHDDSILDNETPPIGLKTTDDSKTTIENIASQNLRPMRTIMIPLVYNAPEQGCSRSCRCMENQPHTIPFSLQYHILSDGEESDDSSNYIRRKSQTERGNRR